MKTQPSIEEFSADGLEIDLSLPEPQLYSNLCQKAKDLNDRKKKVAEVHSCIQLLETVIERMPQAIIQMSLFLAR